MRFDASQARLRGGSSEFHPSGVAAELATNGQKSTIVDLAQDLFGLDPAIWPRYCLGGLVMSAAGLESIDHTVQLTHIWINDLDSRLGWENKHRSYRLLRTVLQALRDWLPVNEAVGL